jgi:DNA-binding transcriptional ArsR family regulator
MVTQARSVFAAIADPTRREILDLLIGGEHSAGEIAARFPISRPAVSRHLRILLESGLVREERRAQSRVYDLAPLPLSEVDAWLASYRLFWASRLQRLKHHVEHKAGSR